MNRTDPPAAPAFEDLPPRRSPATGARNHLTVSLQIVTPILGGGYQTRALDDIDVIRVPTVRGHLRFWWRALFADRFESSASLYDAETGLWGGPGGATDQVPAVRSPIEVRIEVTQDGSKEDGDIAPRTDGAYVLFPARSERSRGQVLRDAAPRRTGVAFTLTVTAPAEHLGAVREAVQAWILFGGYGGRTRRGLGGLTATGPDAATWLPRDGRPLMAELRRLFGRDVFTVHGSARQTPTLAGSALYAIGRPQTGSIAAWLIAVDALRCFRQGTPPDREPSSESGPSAWARQPGVGHEPERPSISNWPEADKIRHLADRELGTGPYSHPPRHNNTPVWPRAGFGLPIVGRFQTRRRRSDSGAEYREPPDFMIKWGEPTSHDEYKVRERLASPLIIKALPLAGGRFVAIALWLHRDWPAGKIVLEINRRVVPGSAAPFDALKVPGETPRFTALTSATLRSAFFDWLCSSSNAVAVVSHRDVAGGAP